MAIGNWDATEASSVPDGAGWVETSDAPCFGFLPAVWPASHRCWLQAGRPVWEWVGGKGGTEPFDDDEVEAFEADANHLLREGDVTSPRPAGRTWYLRLPDGFSDLEAFLDRLTVDVDGPDTRPGDPGFAHAVARQLDSYTWGTHD